MRFSPLLFAVAASASKTLVTRQTDTTEQAAIINTTIDNIRAAVAGLNDGVTAFAGPGDRDALQAASDNVLAVIDQSSTTVSPLPGNIDLTAAASGFADNVVALGNDVSAAIDNAINKKPLFVSSCVGPTVLQALRDQQAGATSYSALVRSKLDQNDPVLLSVSDNLIAGINDPLARGVEAFSDQTSLPEDCETSSTTTSDSPSSTPSTSSSASSSAPTSDDPSTSSSAPSSTPTSDSQTDAPSPSPTESVPTMSYPTSQPPPYPTGGDVPPVSHPTGSGAPHPSDTYPSEEPHPSDNGPYPTEEPHPSDNGPYPTEEPHPSDNGPSHPSPSDTQPSQIQAPPDTMTTIQLPNPNVPTDIPQPGVSEPNTPTTPPSVPTGSTGEEPPIFTGAAMKNSAKLGSLAVALMAIAAL